MHSSRCTIMIAKCFEYKYYAQVQLLNGNYAIFFDTNEIPEGTFTLNFKIIY